MNSVDILRGIENTESFFGASSHYYYGDQKVVRISNHLPKAHNVLDNQEDGDAMVFIFGSEILEYETEETIEAYMEELTREVEDVIEIRSYFVATEDNKSEIDYFMNWLKK